MLVTVLVIINVVFLNIISDSGQKLEEQQSTMVKTEEKLKEKSVESDSLKAKTTTIQSELEKEKLKTQEILKENEGLKAKLQAKIERESKQEPNLYGQGQCTWYVKERIPHIGGTWGNANQWLASAASYGYETGSDPRPGAIGVSNNGYYGHVVYVESITKGGLVEISEMNYAGVGVQSTRTVEYWEFTYIYT